jgi:hypothetical protein
MEAIRGDGVGWGGSVTYYVQYSSVGDPDPEDPLVFGPPESGSGSFPFLIDVLSGLK